MSTDALDVWYFTLGLGVGVCLTLVAAFIVARW